MNGKRYEMSLLPLFEDDSAEIVDYITCRLRNPIAAENLYDFLGPKDHSHTEVHIWPDCAALGY